MAVQPIVRNVRMKVTKEFNRRIDGQLLVGDPEHPDEEGRIVLVSEAGAMVLEDAELAERYSYEDQAAEEAEAANAETGNEDGRAANTDLQTRDRMTPQTRETSNQARTRRTATDKKPDGNARRKPRGKAAPAAGEAGGAPTGGHETNATTNHPTSSLDGAAQTEATNAGADGVPDPDAAPTE